LINCLFFGNTVNAIDAEKKQYNILFIASDDLNDFVGFLGGHPQTKTPNMDRLAKESLVFTKAYCSAALCNPSRASLMSGFHTNTTGVTNNNVNFRNIDFLKEVYTLPQYFTQHGYFCMQRGKIFHSPSGDMSDAISWDLQVAATGSYGTPYMADGFRANGIPNSSGDSNFDWGPTSEKLENTPDYMNALWAAEQLDKNFDKPFFLACGIFKPHLPWYVPKMFFDKFPEESMILPEIKLDDLNDIPGNQQPSVDYNEAVKYNKQKAAIQAYLASINYADSCVGVVLDALRKSKYADNTIVVLWGDHGWHLGEKLRYKKFTSWEESARMPLIIKVPDMTKAASRCNVPVNLLDLYPTLTELCNLPDNTNNEGQSLVPLLKDPETKSNRISWTTQDGQSFRNKNFRYIRRTSGDELYDHRIDSMEWTNLNSNPVYASTKTMMSFKADSAMYLLKSEPRSALRKNKIPGIFQAEKFDRGGEGTAYHDVDASNTGGKWRKVEGVDLKACTDFGGGFQVSSIADSEWLAFTGDSVKKGKYVLKTRLSSPVSDGLITLSMNGKPLVSQKVSITTGWETVQSEPFTINDNFNGDIRFTFNKGGFNLNYFEFEKVGEITALSLAGNRNQVIIYPRPQNGSLYLNVFEFDSEISVSLITLSGQLLYQSGIVNDSVEIPVKSSWPTGMALAVISGKTKTEVQKVMITH
jgi:arylsulfatase A-like enzyme